MSETRERVHIEDGPKRVRTYLGGKLIADTKRLKLVWEVPYQRRAHGPAHSDQYRYRLRVQGLRRILVRRCRR